MEYVFFYFAGLITAFGIIAICNFIFQRLAMKEVREKSEQRHQDAIEHWKRSEDIWQDIADNICNLSEETLASLEAYQTQNEDRLT